MIRRTVIITLSLAALATAGLWLAGYMTPLSWSHRTKTQLVVIAVHDGELMLRRRSSTVDWRSPPASPDDTWTLKQVKHKVPFLGLRLEHAKASAGEAGTVYGGKAVIPLWLVFTLLIFYPVTAFLRGPVRRARRRKRGSCVQCGYNLTGNTSGTCPECGVGVAG